MQIEFSPSERSSLGIEWELALVDRDSGELVHEAESVIAALPQAGVGHGHATHELLLNTVELVSAVHRTVRDAVADIAGMLSAVLEVTDPRGIDAICAGTHPFAQWYDQRVTPSARYTRLMERTQWWGRQMLIWGIHVHVGVRRREHALPIVNGLLTYYPHLQALSASSPFWAGTSTGYASNRALMFQQLPTAGLPYQFESWGQYEAYVGDLMATGIVRELTEVRWDIRPAPQWGTVEVRACDGLSSLDEIRAVAALIQCLTDEMAQQLEHGLTPVTLQPWFVRENKWRAARYGLDARIIVDRAGTQRAVAAELRALVDRLQPVAERLDCVADLAQVESVLQRGASYQRQLRAAERAGGDLRAVVALLAHELRDGLE